MKCYLYNLFYDKRLKLLLFWQYWQLRTTGETVRHANRHHKCQTESASGRFCEKYKTVYNKMLCHFLVNMKAITKHMGDVVL